MAKNQIAIEDFTLIESNNRLMDIVNHKASQHNYPRSVDEAYQCYFFKQYMDQCILMVPLYRIN